MQSSRPELLHGSKVIKGNMDHLEEIRSTITT